MLFIYLAILLAGNQNSYWRTNLIYFLWRILSFLHIFPLEVVSNNAAKKMFQSGVCYMIEAIIPEFRAAASEIGFIVTSYFLIWSKTLKH